MTQNYCSRQCHKEQMTLNTKPTLLNNMTQVSHYNTTTQQQTTLNAYHRTPYDAVFVAISALATGQPGRNEERWSGRGSYNERRGGWGVSRAQGWTEMRLLVPLLAWSWVEATVDRTNTFFSFFSVLLRSLKDISFIYEYKFILNSMQIQSLHFPDYLQHLWRCPSADPVQKMHEENRGS